MYKDDVASIIGALLSTIFAAFSFLYNLGVFQILFPYLAGAFTTYAVQHRLQTESEKREVKRNNYSLMRERIYGPMLRHTRVLMEDIRTHTASYFGNENDVNVMINDHLFFAANKPIREEFVEVMDKFSKYKQIYNAVYVEMSKIVRSKIEENFRVDIGNDPAQVYIRLSVGDSMISAIGFPQLFFQEVTPAKFVAKETEKWGKDVDMKVNIGPADKGKSIEELELVYSKVVGDVEKESIFKVEKSMRRSLLNQLEKFSAKITPLVNLE